ncbi:enoyl-CoA hydratase/isomerase family protein [Actinomadura sp. LOL_016]|uniref:enoyl-CoA hydratase/isomerase family protein n=1 Tax=unclassified Actinomadura TaxID=2626254 RepID=UPI003A7FDEF7
MPQYETLDYTAEDGVAWVTLDRPEVHNAFDLQMIEDLHACWRALRHDDSVRVIVLTGAGDRAFCTGLDRTAAAVGEPGAPGDLRASSTPFHADAPWDLIPPKTGAQLWKPVIAAVNGMACGGAFYLLGEAEFIIASENATFFDPHTTYGLAAVFEPMRMLQRMPLGEVMRMSLMGAHERIGARRAYEVGLVQEVVPPGELLEAAGRAAAVIASQSPRAVQATVRAVWYAQELTQRQALDVGEMLVHLGTDYESLAEGQQAFNSKSRSRWRLR